MDMMLEQFKTIFDRPEKVKKLRETILNLAVRGKLVEQDPNDEPASVLLERIREEKERLVKEKKIKKEKPLAEISEEEKPYELPEGWGWIRFAECVRNIKGVTYKKNFASNEEKDGYELILRGGNIDSKSGQLLLNDNIYIPEGIIKDEQYICNGDTLMVASSGTKSSIAKSTYINSELDKTSVGAFLYIIRPFEIVQSKYINILVRKFRQEIIDTTAGTNISNVNKSSLDEFLTPLPPLEEQKRIVEKVDSLMAFCDKLEEALKKKVHYGSLSAKSVFNSIGNVTSIEELEETLRFILSNFKDLSLGDNAVKELKNCILQLAVQGKLVPQNPNDEPAEVLLEKIRGEKDRLIKEKKIKKEKPLAEISEEKKPYELPKGWEWVRLGTAFHIIMGQSPPSNTYNEFKEGLPFYQGKTDFGEINPKPRKWCSNPSKIAINGDILISVRAPIGPTNVANEECCIGRGLSSIRCLCDISNYYLLYSIRAFEKIIASKGVGSTFTAINSKDLNNFMIPIPPLAEQKRIVEKVDSLMKLCDELEKKIEKSKNYSNRLMESILKSSFLA